MTGTDLSTPLRTVTATLTIQLDAPPLTKAGKDNNPEIRSISTVCVLQGIEDGQKFSRTTASQTKPPTTRGLPTQRSPMVSSCGRARPAGTPRLRDLTRCAIKSNRVVTPATQGHNSAKLVSTKLARDLCSRAQLMRSPMGDSDS